MYQRIAVKVGSNVLTKADGTLDVTRLSALVDQLSEIHASGIEVILISSGAVASGRGEMHLAKDRIALLDEVAQRQLFSAVGQAKLASTTSPADRCSARRRTSLRPRSLRTCAPASR